MQHSVRDIFYDECSHLVIDQRLLQTIARMQSDFTTKNEDHIRFFGGNLLGVDVVRFLPADSNRWFSEILQVDEIPLRLRLISLPDINEDWHVSSDTMNLSCVWLCHAIFESKKLKDEQKREGMLNVMLLLQYKFLTSLLSHYFKYPADREVAEATYAQLSGKFSIKQYGNWFALLRARAEDIISKESIHYRTIELMDDDKKVVYMLNDTQGRIRDIVKNIYAVFDQVNKQGLRISSTSAVIEHDGQEILKDKTRNLTAYVRYINSIVSDKDSFIREELTQIIEKLMYTAPPRLFKQSLVWMSEHYRKEGNDEIEQVLNETLVHAFDYLSKNKDLVRNPNDLPALLGRMKGVYMSSRSADPVLFALREKTEVIVEKATHSTNESAIASVRTAVLLYIILRTFTMRHYTS